MEISFSKLTYKKKTNVTMEIEWDYSYVILTVNWMDGYGKIWVDGFIEKQREFRAGRS